MTFPPLLALALVAPAGVAAVLLAACGLLAAHQGASRERIQGDGL